MTGAHAYTLRTSIVTCANDGAHDLRGGYMSPLPSKGLKVVNRGNLYVVAILIFLPDDVDPAVVSLDKGCSVVVVAEVESRVGANVGEEEAEGRHGCGKCSNKKKESKNRLYFQGYVICVTKPQNHMEMFLPGHHETNDTTHTSCLQGATLLTHGTCYIK